jgi:hypothetical protein
VNVSDGHEPGGVVRRIGLVCLFLFAAGCAGTNNGYLAWQHKNARQIPDPDARGSALNQIATSAAYVGDGDRVILALLDLRDDPRHDECASRCAVQLAQAGYAHDAKRVAKRIGDPVRRKETLDRLEKKPDDAAAEKQ